MKLVSTGYIRGVVELKVGQRITASLCARVYLDGEPIEVVQKFFYLADNNNAAVYTGASIIARFRSGWSKFRDHQPLPTSRLL